MSLKKCIKATANLDNTDVELVVEAFDAYSDSMEQDEAARLAIDDVIETLNFERREYIQLFNETYPNLIEKSLAPKAKKKAKAKKPAEKIEDVGEKIGGARKDVWSGFRESIDTEISDEEILRLPLSKLYPEPNYQKLAEQGADPLALATIKVFRDEIPLKGRNRYKQARYVEQVKMFQNIGQAVLDDTLSAKRVVDKLREAGVLKNLADRIDLMLELGFPTKPANLKGIKFAEVHFSLYKGEKDVNKWIVDITSKSRKSLGGMGGTIAATDTREEAVTALKNYLEAEAAKPKAKKGATKFEIYRYRGVKNHARGWIIGKKIGRNYYDMKEGFDNQIKAAEYLSENQDSLEAQLKKYKEIPAHRKPVDEARLGEDYRAGKDVTAEEFKDTFGFRGVEFGNWVEQKKRQQDVNEAFDGLMDLAKILGIPPKAISLNGELGMAFGARGAGGIDPAKAHYEPGKVVINLTKKAGAGSLAHEWFHGLDNYFSRIRGDAQSYITDRPFPLTNKAVRQEMLDRFKGIITAIKATGLPGRAKILDGKKAKDYWGTNIEMAARTFESYVIGKLKDAGLSNDYLANIVSEEYWKAAEALGLEGESSYPYILEAEMQPVTEAYDALFDSIKTKETEQGTALYSQRPANIGMDGNELSVGNFVQRDTPIETKPKKSVSAKALNKLVSNLQRNYPGLRLLDFEIRETQAEAFGPNSVAENGIIKGGFYSGTNTIILIVENIKDINDALSVIRHEAVGHYGLRQLLGEEAYDKLLARVYEARSGELKAQYDWVAKAYPELVAQNDVRKIADEMLAHAAETKTKSNLLTKIYDAIIKLLNKLGLVLDAVSHKEVNALIRLSEANLRKDIRSTVTSMQQPIYRADDVAPDMFYSQFGPEPAYKDAQIIFDQVRDKFLSLLPEDATFEDMNDVISELDPEYKNFIKALARNEWLGFDYPSQAINAALSEEIQDFEVTKSLKQAIGRMVNKALGVTAATKEKPLFAKKAKIGNEKYKIDLPTKDEITQVILDHPLVKFTGKVKNAYIIGSFAKGSPNEMSDVDVLFEVNKRKGYTEQQLIEKYRRGLQQYFVENKIMERRDDLHPQWNGRRVDIYFTYDASKETRPKVKLPESHAETFDVNDPDVLFSRAADDAGNAPVGQSLGMPEEGKKDLFVRLAQDSFNRIKTMQETILKKGGIIRTESDVYLAEERSSSKISYELKAFENKYQKPLIDLMGDKNLEPEEVDLYVIAKHAQERNEYVASINDDMQDGGSGMTTQQAKDILAEFENKRTDLEAAAQIIYDANNQTLDTLVKEGHMKEEAANELRERWDYYVPLKGKDGEDYKLGTGVGYNIAGSQFKHAMGRGEGNLPESPTAHSFAQAETAIVRTEKSRIGKALVELVRANPDPDFWSIGQRTYKQFEDLYGTPFEGYEDQPPPPMVNNIDYKKVMAITPEERALAKKEGRKPKPKAVFKLDRNYKHRPDVFSVMVEGEELLIKIEDRVVMEQLTKANATQLNAIVRGFGQVNRYLAMVYTGLYPEFVLGNFQRDLGTALIHLSGEQSARLALKVTKDIPFAMRGITQGVFDTKGKSEHRQLWDEMQKEGGAIGFFGLEDIETKVKHLQNKLKRKHGVLGTTKRGIIFARDLILDANLAVENGVRLSAYKVVRDELIANGMPASEAKAKAATVSKNLTVNFNRKGEWAPVFNSLWLFSSVSIQGSARIISSIAKYKRTRQIVAGITAQGFLLAMYNMGSGDDDDGIPYWNKVSDFEKQNNIIFMHPDGDNEAGTGGGGRYFKYRVPYGYNIFQYTGMAMHDLIYNPRATPAKTAMKMLGAVLNAYNPIQGADLLDTITPTIAKPFEQDKRNINFMGGGIRPDYIFDQYDRPSSQKFFGSTNKYLVDAFVSLNELTGGDETHPGWWDWSPQTVKHYTNWLTGGAGMFWWRVGDVATKLATDEEIETRDIPFIRSMVGKPSARFDSERYYEALKQVAAVKAQLKIYKGTDKWSEYKQENEQVQGLSFKALTVKNKIKKLREERDKAYLDDDRDLAKEKAEEIRQKMMEFSILYDEAVEEQE